MTRSLKSAIAVLLLGAASQAMAAQIKLDAALAPGYLAAGSYQSSFHAAPALQGEFTINSLSFSFQFSDDIDAFTLKPGQTGTVTGGPVTVHAEGSIDTITTTTTKTTAVTKTGETETVTLSFGGFSFGGGTLASPLELVSSTDYGVPVVTQVTFTKGNNTLCNPADWGKSGCKKNIYQSVTNNVSNTTGTDYSGNFALGQSLMGYDALVASLLSSKSLGFQLDVLGDLNLLSATLDIDYTLVEKADPGAAVPEPASLALFGIALLGAAGARRRRR